MSSPKPDPRIVDQRAAGFAVLTVDWHLANKSYSDNFVNFVLSAVERSGKRKFTDEDAHSALSEVYDINLPQKVVHNIVRRAHKSGLVDRDDGMHYSLSISGTKAIDGLASDLGRSAREQRNLEKALVEFAAHSASLEMTEEAAGIAILSYIETYYGTLMSTSVGSGSIGASPPAEPTQVHRVTAAFIGGLAEYDPERFAYVLRIAQGSMLVAALFTPAPVQLERSFHDTTLFLDTKILFRLLGYEGSVARDAVSEYLNLAASQGAVVACYDFTMSEMRSVMAYYQVLAKKNRLWTARPGTVGAYYFSIDATPGEIDLDIASLESRLSKLGLAVTPSPSFDPRYVVDEKLLEDSIKAVSPNYRESALLHDVKALAAIVRSRRGKARDNFEDCKAVFITLNARLLRASRQVQDLRDEPWAVAMYEADAATLLWIKSPPKAPDLPRATLLATCMGLLHPSESMWPSYVKELEHLQESGQLGDAELILVRQRYETSQLAFISMPDDRDETFRESVATSIAEAREQVTEQLEEPLKAELATAQLKESTAVDRARDLEADLAGIKARAEAQAAKTARGWAGATRWTLTALLVGAVLASLLPGIPVALTPLLDSVGKVVVAVGLIAGSLLAPGKAISTWVENKVRLRELRRIGILPADDSTR